VLETTNQKTGDSVSVSTKAALYDRLLNRQLGRMLQLVDLEVQGVPVEPSSFRLGNGSAPRNTDLGAPLVRYEALLSYARNDPRLELLQRGLQRLLRLGQFLGDQQPLPVDGFRLRELAQWANYPMEALADNIGSLSSYCNCDCEFCYEKGTRGADIALGRAQLSMREVNTRLRYYSLEKKTGLLPSSRFSLEPFANPHCLEILERIHAAAPEECTNLTTNGACLTEEVVARLARLRPTLVTLSMNAATVDLRMVSMRDRQRGGAETAFASIPLLRDYEIPFVGSYVPWPTKPLSDLEEMVRLLDRYEGVVARVCLPSWTQYSASESPFDTQEYWESILAMVDKLRQEVAIPIHLMPNMYQLRTMRPVVQGTIINSPAAQAGFQYGDLILAVDDQTVSTRPGLSRLLAQRFEDPQITETRFTIARGGQRLEIKIPHVHDLEALNYPYRYFAQPGAPRTWAGSLGLHIADGFELTSFVRLKQIVEEYPGQKVLLFISPLAEPYFFEGMEMLGELAAFVDTAEMYVERLWPRAWGGNVIIGDLWTVSDLIEQTHTWIREQGFRPDVVIVPWSFLSAGGRDLRGRCFKEFEWALDLELRLLPCETINI